MKKKFFSGQELMLIVLCFIIPLMLFLMSGFFNEFFNKYFPLFNSNPIGFELVGKYFFILFFILAILIARQGWILIRNYFILRKAKKNEFKDYDTAIIIANQENFSLKNMLLSPYSYSFKHFFELINLKNIKYKIFENISIKKFDNLIKNSKVKNYYLFGHGSRHAFELFEKNPVYYCKYKSLNLDKDYIAQYHCNHGFGKSLADYTVKDLEKRKICDIGNCERKPQDLKKQWKNEIKELKKIKYKK